MADAIPTGVEAGLEACRRGAWRDAYEAYAAAAGQAALQPAELELFATAAYLSGHSTAFREAMERAHHAHARAGDRLAAVRCAFWLGFLLLFHGEAGAATGWLGRAARLLEGIEAPCAEAGYLKLPVAEQHLAGGNAEAAHRVAAEAAALGERFQDAGLAAAARHQQGRALILQGRIGDGLALLDEAMVVVTSAELAPIMTGLLYCSVIDACWQICELARAREWTAAMGRWCERQPQMAAFRGTCLVHRAELLQLRGEWTAAFEAAASACAWSGAPMELKPPGAAFYQQGEVHRLRGEFPAAEQAYREAALRGHEPQPGLALLRLAKGRVAEAGAALTRVLSATRQPQERARLLPTCIEVMLRLDRREEAARACEELERLASHFRSSLLAALAAQARGTLELAAGNASAAIAPLRSAWHGWEKLEAPYAAARARELIGLACASLGDEEAARLELEAARSAFERLGALADLARLAARGAPRARSLLTGREADVLRLVAQGKTNKLIARELRLSVKTVDRHLSNIFGKLQVSSRAAAIARAYERKLI